MVTIRISVPSESKIFVHIQKETMCVYFSLIGLRKSGNALHEKKVIKTNMNKTKGYAEVQ